MKRLLCATLIVASLLGSRPAAQSGYELFQQALSKEQAEGKLPEAIALYQRIAKSFASDRALTAKALLRLADCYQKVGDVQARTVLERVVREYSDQKEAVAIAREQLGAAATIVRAKGDRPVWSGPAVDGFGTVSPDGRYLTYADWAGTGGLMLRDLEKGTDRRLTAGSSKDGQTQFSAISRDGRQVAFQWLNSSGRYELRTASLQGVGIPESHRLVDIEESRGIAVYDWSPDDKWLAVHVARKDFSGQIALVDSSNGALRVLKSVDWKGPTKIFFSPDGRFIAYDLSTDDRRLERNVYVMAVDGSREAAIVDDHSANAPMGWSPDGTHLLFASDRSGSVDLWAAPIADGRPHGAAFLIRPNVGTHWSNGIAAGTMYVWKNASPIYLQVASIDLAAGRLSAVNPGNRQFIASRGRPAWSLDGKQLVYQSCGSLGGGPCRLLIRSTDTGQSREVPTPLIYTFFPHFSPDGKSLIARANDPKGHTGIYRIDAVTGESSLVIDRAGVNPWWSRDGERIFYWLRDAEKLVIAERNVTTGASQEVVRIAAPGVAGETISPDEQQVAIISTLPDGTETVSVVPFHGGAVRTLLRVSAPVSLLGEEVKNPAWTPDNRSLLVIKTLGTPSDEKELWLVPIDGSQPRKLDIDVNRWAHGDGFRLSPDGRQIAFVAATGRTGQEIWALENLLPSPTAKRQTARK